MLGPAAEAAVRGAEEKARLETWVSYGGWGLVRRAGRWVTRARLTSGEPNGEVWDADVPVAPPASLVGHDRLVPAWSEVKRRFPDARAAFSSPAGDLLVVLTPKSLAAILMDGGRLALDRGVTVPARPGEAAVMAQWAEGPDAATWAAALAKVPVRERASRPSLGRPVAPRSSPRRYGARGVGVCDNRTDWR